MNNQKQFVFSLSATTIGIFINLFFNWPLLATEGLLGNERFGDLALVFDQIQCIKNEKILNPEIRAEECGYIYGSLLPFILQNINPTINQIFGLGLISIIIFLFAVFTMMRLLLRFNSKLEYFLIPIIISSPPIMLLMERGNLDLVIFGMVFISATLMRRRKYSLAISTLALSIGMKIYPIFTLPLFFILLKKRHFFYNIPLIFISVYWVVENLKFADKIPSGWYAFFGAEVFSEYITAISNIELSQITSFSIGLIFVVSSLIVLLFLNGKNALLDALLSISFAEATNRQTFLLFGLLYVGVFISSPSYDYRLALLIPLTLLISTEIENERYKRIFWIYVIAIFWLSYPASYLQIVGDTLNLGLVAIVISVLFRNYHLEMKLQRVGR